MAHLPGLPGVPGQVPAVSLARSLLAPAMSMGMVQNMNIPQATIVAAAPPAPGQLFIVYRTQGALGLQDQQFTFEGVAPQKVDLLLQLLLDSTGILESLLARRQVPGAAPAAAAAAGPSSASQPPPPGVLAPRAAPGGDATLLAPAPRTAEAGLRMGAPQGTPGLVPGSLGLQQPSTSQQAQQLQQLQQLQQELLASQARAQARARADQAARAAAAPAALAPAEPGPAGASGGGAAAGGRDRNLTREHAVQRYLQKRNKRKEPGSSKPFRYAVRSEVAARMKRVKGQFKGVKAEFDQEEAATECMNCGVAAQDTPMMRRGADGKRNLCNACGLVFSTKGILRKVVRKQPPKAPAPGPAEAPAPSPAEAPASAPVQNPAPAPSPAETPPVMQATDPREG